ncbi:unnamed protein product, partial [Rotaria socialis]
DYAVVELFVTQYPATKQQTSKDGLTALKIAQKLKFPRIAQLIETGKSVPAPNDSSSESKEPVHSYEVLVEASRNGRI